MMGNKKGEGRECTVLSHIIGKSRKPSENELTTNLSQKSLCLSKDSNPAYSDRMPSLYSHHGPGNP